MSARASYWQIQSASNYSHFPVSNGIGGRGKHLARRASRCPVDAQSWEKMIKNAPKL